ncbi:DUF6183 family protein [Streptomyces sp. NPDC046860]|uniref:DUF6183 family protein n=1 Tax=Streptomyces sp. NPDC046860 TaxID=3154495 RepID=UPI0033FED9E9
MCSVGGGDDDTGPGELERGTTWFYLAWDIGVAALAPGRRHLAVPAATDTD